MPALSIDHLVIAVADLEAAARHYRAERGIPFAAGGLHAGGSGQPLSSCPSYGAFGE